MRPRPGGARTRHACTIVRTRTYVHSHHRTQGVCVNRIQIAARALAGPSITIIYALSRASRVRFIINPNRAHNSVDINIRLPLPLASQECTAALAFVPMIGGIHTGRETWNLECISFGAERAFLGIFTITFTR